MALLAGCTVGPNFERPAVPMQSKFLPVADDVPSRATESASDEAWWAGFGDTELASLVERLVRQNLDLARAAERLAQARAQRAVVASQGLPHLDARASFLHERESKNGLVSLEQAAPNAPLEFNLLDASLAASWELDLFGRVRRAVEAADADTQVMIEARREIALEGIADLVQAYLQLRGAQAREAVTQQTIALAQQRRQLVRERRANEVATLSDVAAADAQTSAAAEELPPLRSMEANLISTLGLLLGEPPHGIEAELRQPATQPPVPPIVPVGIPGELLRRRPDIRQAEARLHSATAQTGVAVAEFYPDITLTGNLGGESLHPGGVFEATSRMFMVGPGIDLPIFEGGRLRGTLHLREAAQREAAIVYQKAVLQAWHDVDNALTAYAETQRRETAVAAAARSDEASLQYAEQRYQQGVADLLGVIDAEGEVLRDQNSLAQARTDVETQLVNLFKALGGGWRAADGPAT